MADIQGTVDERFASVADVLSGNLDSGADVGASVCVVHDGETVVDIWGGTIDDDGTPWAEDTIINVWSTTKTMTFLTALLLADRGELDFHAPVAAYWPEFAANGKEAIEVRHLMSHTAGLAGWVEPIEEADLYDWEKATSLLAAQAPLWEPGTRSGYHALTQGYLVGEVIRRVTGGTTVGQLFAKEIAGPLGADFHIGTAPEHDHRVALVIPPDQTFGEQIGHLDPALASAMSHPPTDARWSWSEAWRRAEIPAAGGHGNARSVARAQSVLSHGGEVDGIRLLSPAGCEVVFELQISGEDLILPLPVTFGMGYGISSPEMPIGPNARTCFWGGWGGSIVINDLENRLTIAYVMNKMGQGTTGDDRGIGLVFATYGSILGALG
ncbi:MAG: serine hydrolase domain-containing protein [Acidimicrobiales bacterium]